MHPFIFISSFVFQLVIVFLSFSVIRYQELVDGGLYAIYNKYPVIITSYTSSFEKIGNSSYCYGPWSCLLKNCYSAVNNETAIIGTTFTYQITNNTCSKLKSYSSAMNYINKFNLFSETVAPLMILALTLEFLNIPVGILAKKLSANFMNFIYSFINFNSLFIELLIFVLFGISREKMFSYINDHPPSFITTWYYISQSILVLFLIYSHIYSIMIVLKKKHDYLYIN